MSCCKSPKLLSISTSFTLLVMAYVSSSGDRATSSWMPSGVWGCCGTIMPGVLFPPWGSACCGCWFSLLLSSARLTGSRVMLGGPSSGLAGGDGDERVVTGLLSENQPPKMISINSRKHFTCIYVKNTNIMKQHVCGRITKTFTQKTKGAESYQFIQNLTFSMFLFYYTKI